MSSLADERIKNYQRSIERGEGEKSQSLARSLPFEATLSFAPLLRYWRQAVDTRQLAGWLSVSDGDGILAWLDGPITDMQSLAGHRALVERLLTPVISPLHRNRDLEAVLVPASNQVVYATEPFVQRFGVEEGRLDHHIGLQIEGCRAASLRFHILREAFGIDFPFTDSALVAQQDPGAGLTRYYRACFDHSNIDVILNQPDALHESERIDLQTSAGAAVDWIESLVPDAVTLSGFEWVRLIDVTDQHILSLFKTDLIGAERGLSPEVMPILDQRLRNYLQKPELRFGLAAYEGEQLRLLGAIYRIALDPFIRIGHQDPVRLHETFVGRSLFEKKVHVVEDLERLTDRTAYEDELLQAGVRSALVAPLFWQAEPIGVLYLWSTRPGDLSSCDVERLEEVIPLCAAAVNRSREDLNHRIQSVILGSYTAIHPSVEWRFRKAALNYIRRQDRGLRPEIEPIVFDDVYPLYAVADIRSSSNHRNEAVGHDLTEHLTEVEEVLSLAAEAKPLPILDYLKVRASRYRQMLLDGLSSDEEAAIKDFVARNIEPLLDHLSTFSGAVKERIARYRENLDPRQGRLYRQSRAFEESIAIINGSIFSYLEEEEQRAQAMCPHYFEQHQTDGVDFSIYAGASIMENGVFNPLYIRNLRLWQLMVMCGISQRTSALKETLPVPLETTGLILAHSTPITIRFQLSETRFDVDGTHDIRYEITKRRLDKAQVKGTSERLTQPGRIAIVYSQAREAWEYEDYVRFLQTAAYLEPGIEEVEIEDLQGIKGLKALRVTVAPGGSSSGDGVSTEVIERAILSMPREHN